MNLTTKINLRFPQLFEYCFEYFTRKLIRTDFEPNGYVYFKSDTNINNWCKEYFEYFKTNAEEYSKKYFGAKELLPVSIFSCYPGYQLIDINSYLQNDTNDYSNSIINKINGIDSDLRNFRLRDNVVVLRRISNRFLRKILLRNRNLHPGLVLKDKGFLSTSLDLSYRKIGEGQYKPINNETLLIIKVPKGINGLYLEPLSKRNEYELLLPNNLKLVVEKNIRILNNNIILVQVLKNEL